jgi:hypothetical protein
VRKKERTTDNQTKQNERTNERRTSKDDVSDGETKERIVTGIETDDVEVNNEARHGGAVCFSSCEKKEREKRE